MRLTRVVRLKNSFSPSKFAQLPVDTDEGPSTSAEELWSDLAKMKRESPSEFTPTRMHVGTKSLGLVYGGQYLVNALSAARETVAPKYTPHIMHSHFIKSAKVTQPLKYVVDKTYDGKSFLNRSVKAFQNNDLIFTSQISFHEVEHSAVEHRLSTSLPSPSPDTLRTEQELVKMQLQDDDTHMAAKGYFAYKQFELVPSLQKMYLTKPVDQEIFKMNEKRRVRKPTYHIWMKPTILINESIVRPHEAAVFASDFWNMEAAMLPYISEGLVPSKVCTLNHSMHFHASQWTMNDWTYWEQSLRMSHGGRVYVHCNVFDSQGLLVASSNVEGLLRAVRIS